MRAEVGPKDDEVVLKGGVRAKGRFDAQSQTSLSQ